MKTWIVRLSLAAVLIAIGIWGWRYFFPPPERIIRQRLTELAQVVSFSPREAPLAKLSNSQKLTTFFADDLVITIDVASHAQKTFNGRDELLQAAMGARSVISSFSVQFLDINVAFSPDKSSATANLTAKGSVAGEKDSLVQELKFTFKKIGRDWIINRVETIKTLSCVPLTVDPCSAGHLTGSSSNSCAPPFRTTLVT